MADLEFSVPDEEGDLMQQELDPEDLRNVLTKKKGRGFKAAANGGDEDQVQAAAGGNERYESLEPASG